MTLYEGGKDGTPIIRITTKGSIGSDFLIEGVGLGVENWERSVVRDKWF